MLQKGPLLLVVVVVSFFCFYGRGFVQGSQMSRSMLEVSIVSPGAIWIPPSGTVNENRYLRTGRLLLASGGANTDRWFLILGVITPTCIALVYVIYVCVHSCRTPEENEIQAKGLVDIVKQFAAGPSSSSPKKPANESGKEEDSGETPV